MSHSRRKSGRFPNNRDTGWRWVSLAVTGAMAVPIVAGLLGVLLPALGVLPAIGAADPGTHVLRELFAEPGLWRSIGVSAFSGLLATAVSVVLTAAILAATFGSRALGAAERLLAPVLSVPHAAAALGFAFLFAPSGMVLRLISPWPSGWERPPDVLLLNDPFGIALMFALILKEVPFLFLMALAALNQVQAREHFAVARTLGYGRLAAFVHGVWPLIYRQLRLPVLAVLAFSVSVVDMALILGPTRPATLSVRIVGWLQSDTLSDWLVGSAGAVVMLALVVLLIGIWRVLERVSGALLLAARQSGARFRADAVERWAVCIMALAGSAVLFAGLAGLIAQSFAGWWPFPDNLPTTVSAGAWAERGPEAIATLMSTITIALGATAIALPLAVLLLEATRRGVRVWWLIYTPLLVPQVSFLFGLTVLAVAVGATPGAFAVTLVHALFALPYALIALAGPWDALDPRYEGVAVSLGKGGATRFWRVRLPLMMPSLCVAAALCVAVSVGLYLPTQMIGGGRVVTVTTEAVAAASGGDRRLIGIFATLQLLLPFLAFALARVVPKVLARSSGRAAP